MIRRVRIAVQFLTRIPVGSPRYDEGSLRASTGAFPFVGLLVAVVVVSVRWLAGLAVPDVAATVLALGAGALMTGAFHEDGFADAFDGLWGGHTPERRLEIMRDSRLGTYGVLALVFLIGSKIALLAPLDVTRFAAAVATGMVLGRASSLPLMRWMPPAPGSTAALAGAPSTVSLVVGGLTVLATVVVAFGWWAWLPVLTAAVVTLICAAVFRPKIGGVNGDTLGATNQLVEVTVYVCAAALA